MIVSIIVAMTPDRVIGKNNQLPWYLPADLKHFKASTMDKPIIMGRKTFDSIGKPLPGRHNIVVTRQKDLSLEGCTVVASIAEAIEQAGEVKEAMIIGGASIYQDALPLADRLYLTLIKTEIEGDAFFPAFDKSEWRVLSQIDHQADEKNIFDYSFLFLEKSN